MTSPTLTIATGDTALATARRMIEELGIGDAKDDAMAMAVALDPVDRGGPDWLRAPRRWWIAVACWVMRAADRARAAEVLA